LLDGIIVFLPTFKEVQEVAVVPLLLQIQVVMMIIALAVVLLLILELCGYLPA
jgi:hypothetical protein